MNEDREKALVTEIAAEEEQRLGKEKGDLETTGLFLGSPCQNGAIFFLWQTSSGTHLGNVA